MGLLTFAGDYLLWHYGAGIRDFLALAQNILWFSWRFFSVAGHLRTLFAPFARIRQTYFNINDIEASLQNLTANVISRLVGFVLRTVVILAGIACELVLATLLALAWIAWVALPLLVAGLILLAL